MPYGYNGRILHVNLTDATWQIEEPGEVWYRTYVGGSSLAAYYLLKKINAGIDPLSEENVDTSARSSSLPDLTPSSFTAVRSNRPISGSTTVTSKFATPLICGERITGRPSRG
jgi:hypothetical protein